MADHILAPITVSPPTSGHVNSYVSLCGGEGVGNHPSPQLLRIGQGACFGGWDVSRSSL